MFPYFQNAAMTVGFSRQLQFICPQRVPKHPIFSFLLFLLMLLLWRLWLCVYTYVHVCVSVCVCLCVCVTGGQSSASVAFIRSQHTLSFETGSLTGTLGSSSRLVVQQAQGIQLSVLQHLLQGYWDLNFTSHTYTASVQPTELSPPTRQLLVKEKIQN